MDFEDTDVSWPLGRSVVKGEIDNTDRQNIKGRIWLKGRDEPLELDLRGNCMRDIAGCKLVFTNSQPVAGDDLELASLQTGVAGEMTASRKIHYYAGPDADALSEKIGNCIFLEWFSDVNGRVVLEGPDFEVRILKSNWFMSPEDERRQIETVADSLARWEREIEEYEEYDSEPRRMNEFEWERNLRESDALTERFSKVLEKYLDHPNCDRLIAREMGWTWLIESGEDDVQEIDDEEDEDDEDYDEDFDMEPNPLTEGVDWVKGSNGRVTHPLTNRSFTMAMELWSCCKKGGNLGDESDKDLKEMIFQVQALTAKLAGALDSLAYDFDTDGGLVVACLKRALPCVNGALACADNVQRKLVMDEKKLTYFRRKMLEVREEIISLMARYRKHAD